MKWQAETFRETVIHCLLDAVACSKFDSEDDRHGGAALLDAALYMLMEDGYQEEAHGLMWSSTKEDCIQDLWAYFNYLDICGLDHRAQNAILNAIYYLSGKSREEILEQVRTQLGWEGEK